jgi:hypothetical protein
MTEVVSVRDLKLSKSRCTGEAVVVRAEWELPIEKTMRVLDRVGPG